MYFIIKFFGLFTRAFIDITAEVTMCAQKHNSRFYLFI